MKNLLHFKIFLFAILFVSACTSSSEQNTKPNAELENTRWVLRVLSNKKVFIPESGTEIYITFKSDGNKFNGNGGCNTFFGSYTKNKNNITLGPVARTRMYCEPFMETENKFIAALEKTYRYKIKGDFLYSYSDDSLLAKFEAIYLK